MHNNEVRLERLTRREFRQAQEAGHFEVAIIATGSIEQHLEHLALDQDIRSSTYVAERVASKLYPSVVVAVPISVGIAEHHMHFSGTLTASPGPWLAVVFDAVESLMRHGVKRVLVLNGHGGNRDPIGGVMRPWRLRLTDTQGIPLPAEEQASFRTHVEHNEALLNRDDPGVDLRFLSYWDVIPEDFAESVLETGSYPGHATEFETSFALFAFPESVRPDAIQHSGDRGASAATADKGRLMAEKAVDGVAAIVEKMLSK